MSPDDKVQIVKTHFAVISNVLESEEQAADFLAWSAKFFSENPNILKDISNPKTRDRVFSTAVGLMKNPLIKGLF